MGVTDWRSQAACRGMDTKLFFPERGHALPKTPCAACPVKAECLAFALDNREKFGCWGGMSERQRVNLRRGRPASRRAS